MIQSLAHRCTGAQVRNALSGQRLQSSIDEQVMTLMSD